MTQPPECGIIWDMVPTTATPNDYRDTRNKFRTRSLFIEWELPPYPAYYTIGPDDRGPHRSLRRLYLETRDPTEKEFSENYLGGWDHHQLMLKGCKWYREMIEEWRVELRAVMKAEAIRTIRLLAANPKEKGATRLAAAKFLSTLGDPATKPTANPKSKRGRPSNEEVAGELKAAVRAKELLEEDALRLGLGDELTVTGTSGFPNRH